MYFSRLADFKLERVLLACSDERFELGRVLRETAAHRFVPGPRTRYWVNTILRYRSFFLLRASRFGEGSTSPPRSSAILTSSSTLSGGIKRVENRLR